MRSAAGDPATPAAVPRLMDLFDKLAVVIELAALTDDLERRERRALIDAAHHVDKRRNQNVLTNRRYATAGAPGGGSLDSIMVVPPSGLGRLAGSNRPDCKICTKEITLQAQVALATPGNWGDATPENRVDTGISPEDSCADDRRPFGQQQLPLTTDTQSP